MSAIMITGYTGTRHIRPSMDAAVYRGAFGNDSYVLSADDNCAGSMPSVNEFVVADGCVSMQGHTVQIKLESLDVDTCATGYARIDLVCCRFTHNTSSLIDNAELVVIKGDEVADSNTPQPPTYSEGIIDEGATQVDFPMYEITMHGGTVTYRSVHTLAPSLTDDKAKVAKYTGDNTTTSLSAGTMTKVSLTTESNVDNNTDYFELFDGGIRIKKKGCYRIHCSAFMAPAQAVYAMGVFLRQSDSATPSLNTYENSSEIAVGTLFKQTSGSSGQGAPQVSILINSTNDCDTFFMACRTQGSTGTLYNDNNMTFMDIEYIGE